MNRYARRPLAVAVLGIAWLWAYNAHAQEIVSTLRLGRNEPRPIWFEYSPLDEGLVTVGQLKEGSDRNIGLFKYDNQFKRQWQVDLFEQNGRKVVDQLVVLGDLVLVFVSEYHPREKEIEIKLYQYSLEGKLLADGSQIFTSRNEPKHRNILRFEKSIDKKKLLVLGTMDNPDAEENELEYQYLVFDVKNDTVRKGAIRLEEQNRFRLKEVRIGSKGSIFLLGKQRVGEEGIRFVLYKQDGRNETLLEIPLNFGANFIVDLTCKPDIEEDLIITGFYSDRVGPELSGALFAKLEAVSNYVSVITYDRFTPVLINRYVSARDQAKGRSLTDFYLDQMVLRADGGALVLAEQYYVSSSAFRDAYGFYNSRTTYHYDDIMVLSISPQGKIEWTSIVQKAQVAITPDELSYTLFVGPEDLYVFYKHTYPGTGTNVYFHTVSAAGQASTPKAFFPNFAPSNTFYRRSCEQINNNEGILVYYAPSSRTFSLARVAF